MFSLRNWRISRPPYLPQNPTEVVPLLKRPFFRPKTLVYCVRDEKTAPCGGTLTPHKLPASGTRGPGRDPASPTRWFPEISPKVTLFPSKNAVYRVRDWKHHFLDENRRKSSKIVEIFTPHGSPASGTRGPGRDPAWWASFSAVFILHEMAKAQLPTIVQ